MLYVILNIGKLIAWTIPTTKGGLSCRTIGVRGNTCSVATGWAVLSRASKDCSTFETTVVCSSMVVNCGLCVLDRCCRRKRQYHDKLAHHQVLHVAKISCSLKWGWWYMKCTTTLTGLASYPGSSRAWVQG